MPIIITHGIVGATLGAVSRPRPRRLLVAAAICAALPDLDVVTFRLGIPYGDMLGHRGLSHSIVAAIVVATVVAGVFRFNDDERRLTRSAVWTALFVATLSHGLLDAMTDGGLGVAFFAPFSAHRYFFAWRPIAVSPIGVGFFSTRGLTALWSEIVWVWIPTLGVAALAWYRDRRWV